MTYKPPDKTLDRRAFLTTGTVAGAGLGLGVAMAADARDGKYTAPAHEAFELDAAEFGLICNSTKDQTQQLQAALNAAATAKAGLRLRPGTYIINRLELTDGTRVIGSGASTVLLGSKPEALITGTSATNLHLCDMTLDGSYTSQSLIRLKSCTGMQLKNLVVRCSREDAIHLTNCQGSISDCDISNAEAAAIHSFQSRGLMITNNTVHDCNNNGIQIWRSKPGDDGSLVSHNRIANIRAKAGGSGQYGNGVNVFRAGNVQVNNNRITDCDYSAVRSNAASNIQMVANHCLRIGEVALYAEFGFQGALIANNVVDTAATGISVTNFNEGGRLGVVQGNLVRNLFRREHEPEDKRGNGIAVEADTTITGNTIEGAPSAGIVIGWGSYMRDVVASGNLIRKSGSGVLISSALEAGACIISNNMLSGAEDGAIRRHETGRAIGPELANNDSHTGGVAIKANIAV